MNIAYICMNVILVSVLRSVHWIHSAVLHLILKMIGCHPND
jgi:hypothetical protein